MSNTSEMRQLVRQLIRAGHPVVRVSGSGHWEVTCPSGRRVQIPYSPSDHRSIRNVKARLRREGVTIR